MKRLYIPILLLFMAMVFYGCATNPYEPVSMSDEEIMAQPFWSDFVAGDLEMTQGGWVTGYSAATKYARNVEKVEFLSRAEKWPALVKTIYDHNFGDDVNLYLLGIAARELGYTNAARTYLEQSILESDRALRGKCISKSTCLGFTFPQDAEAALATLGED